MSTEFAGAAWKSEAAQAFGRHMLRIVAAESAGQWMNYGVLYARTIREIPDNPFVRYLNAKPARRAKVKYVLLEAMNAFPGLERSKDADHQSAPVWFRQDALEISSDPKLVGRYFQAWHRAMLETAIREPALWRLPAERIVFRNQPNRHSAVLGARTAVGVDPLGNDWAVQINEAKRPGNTNVATAIARDAAGRPYLLHQGRLRGNGLGGEVLEEAFATRTRLKPVAVSNGDTRRVRRVWYVVTALDLNAEEIRRNTARFVDMCVIARLGGAKAASPADLAVLEQLYAADETGGTNMTGARPAADPKVIRKYQGEVWQRMAALLRAKKISVEKPCHAVGYEVDAEIVNKSRRILVEIKSSASASSVYTGVGQLLLYRKLLPSLANHVPVLLLPHDPTTVLAAALDECEIHWCTVNFTETDGEISVTFSDKFLRLCGVTPTRKPVKKA
jgi:hypothetical protein